MAVSQVAIVTGASRGIGAAVALALGREGYIVAGTATTDGGAEAITQYCLSNGIEGRGFCLDVCSSDSVAALVDNVQNVFGAPGVLVNNAGVTDDNLFLRMRPEQWDRVIDTNLTSIYRVTKACLKPMLKARFGRVINVSSVVAATGNPGQANYCASKAGMIGMSKSLALELAGRGITINVVAPGYIETDMTMSLVETQKEAMLSQVPANKIGQPEDIAHAVVFLASVKAQYITGQTLHVNGGMFMG